MSLGIDELTKDRSQVGAGDFPQVSAPAIIPGGQDDVTAALTIMQEGAAPGEWIPCTAAAEAKAVSVEEVDATGADPVSTIIYKTGEYLATGVSYDVALESAPGVLDPVAIAALEAVNIYVK